MGDFASLLAQFGPMLMQQGQQGQQGQGGMMGMLPMMMRQGQPPSTPGFNPGAQMPMNMGGMPPSMMQMLQQMIMGR